MSSQIEKMMMMKESPLWRISMIFIFIPDISHFNSYAASPPPSMILLTPARRHHQSHPNEHPRHQPRTITQITDPPSPITTKHLPIVNNPIQKCSAVLHQDAVGAGSTRRQPRHLISRRIMSRNPVTPCRHSCSSPHTVLCKPW